MICYHGSIYTEIKVLQPRLSPFANLKYPCVYLSTNEALASIYIWNKPYKFMTFEIRDDSLPVYNESFKNGLREFYDGVSGCIYKCDVEFETDPSVHIKYAVISKKPVPVKTRDIVDNAYEKILLYEKKGLLVINRFETLTEQQRENDRRMVRNTIKNLNLLSSTHPLSAFVSEKFPSLWQEAIKEQNKAT
jgi:hypothetical protein